MASKKIFYFKEANKYTLSDSNAIEVEDNYLRLKDLGAYFSDQATFLLFHLDETNNVSTVVNNGAGSSAPETITFSGNPWVKILDPYVPAVPLVGTYNFKYIDAINSIVFGLNDCTGQAFLARYNGASADADYALGSVTYVAGGGGVTVSAGKMQCGGTGSAKYDIVKNANFTQMGSTWFRVVPNYSGAPALAVPIFSITGSAVVHKNSIYFYHKVDGNLSLKVKDLDGVDYDYDFGVWGQTAASSYEFSLNMDFDTGSIKLFMNGTQFGSTWVQTLQRDLVAMDHLNVGSCFDFLPGTYFDGDFEWFSVHRNYILHDATYVSGTEPVTFSPSGSLMPISGSYHYKLYYDIDSELAQEDTNSIVAKIVNYGNKPTANQTTAVTISYVSVPGDADRYKYPFVGPNASGCTLGLSGLFNKTAYGFDGFGDYLRCTYSVNMSIAANNPLTVDASIYLEQYSDVNLIMHIVGNTDPISQAGWSMAINGNCSKVYFYKHDLTQFACASVPVTRLVKIKNWTRLSIVFDPGGITIPDKLRFYMDSVELEDVTYGNVAAPVNITGVNVRGTTTPFTGNKLLNFTVVGLTYYLSWDGGSTVDVTAGGTFYLPSSVSGHLVVDVEETNLPLANDSDTLMVSNYFDPILFQNSTTDYFVGSYQGTTSFFKGRLDEVRASRGARTLGELTNSFYATSSPYAILNQTYTPGNLLGWTGFLYNTGLVMTGQVRFQFSNNNGSSFIYYNTVSELWEPAPLLTDSNTAAQLTPGVMAGLTLPTNVSLKTKIILVAANENQNALIDYFGLEFNATPFVDKSVDPTFEFTADDATIAFTPDSRYSKGRIYQGQDVRVADDNLRIIDGRTIPVLLPQASDTLYTVRAHEVNRLDLISLQFYGTPIYWWIIADVNEIYDPFNSLTVGQVIRVPAIDRVVSI